jgi:hypothetical protein
MNPNARKVFPSRSSALLKLIVDKEGLQEVSYDTRVIANSLNTYITGRALPSLPAARALEVTWKIPMHGWFEKAAPKKAAKKAAKKAPKKAPKKAADGAADGKA